MLVPVHNEHNENDEEEAPDESNTPQNVGELVNQNEGM
jgi:hypothetical protein